LYGIEVRQSGAGILVELWGEFDLFSLTELREALNSVTSLRRPTLVDLSGITFLDPLSARELAIRSQLYSHYLIFANPSFEVTTSARAFGLEGWACLHGGGGRRESPIISEVS
jgi:anti-anti-sigma regulatory factor